MNRKPPYRSWVGLLLGLLLPGAAHYMSGQRQAALRWYLAISLTGRAGIVTLAISGLAAYIASVFIFALVAMLWLVMLKQSCRRVQRIGLRGWVAVLGLTLLLTSLWDACLKQVVTPCRVATGAMFPSLVPGDHVLVERVSYRFRKPKRGEVIVYTAKGLNHPQLLPDDYHAKRIVGLPGERIRIDPPHLLVNGEVVRAPRVFNEISSRSSGFTPAHVLMNPAPYLSDRDDEILLGDKEYLTIGDNMEHSLDGRYYGPITKRQILGRVSRIYWPLSRIQGQVMGQPEGG